LLNNVLLVVAATLVLMGTLAPLVIELLNGGKISIGPPWFEVAFLVPMIPLVLLLGLGMHTAWRTQDPRSWFALLRIPAIAAVLLGIVLPLMFYGRTGLLLLRRKDGSAGITRSALGMSVAHLGMGLFVLGATVTSAFNIESDRALTPGESIDVGGYDFAMLELRNVDGPNYSAIEAEIEIRKDGDYVATVLPQKRQYLVQKNWMTEAGIYATWNKDLFVALGDQLGNGAWSVRVQYKPMIRFIWFGAIIMALGGLIAISDRRYRLKASKTSKVSRAAAESA
jgi:cytochrome c-type biogenesis protein CcmF